MTERDLINCVESVRGVRVVNMATMRPGMVQVRVKHSFWSWFVPGLRRCRLDRVRSGVECIRPFNVGIRVVPDAR